MQTGKTGSLKLLVDGTGHTFFGTHRWAARR
jgi:hypothetical protein